jgi:hypothetical protein
LDDKTRSLILWENAAALYRIVGNAERGAA